MPADALSRVFAALSDPTRRDMVARLATADATVGERYSRLDEVLAALPDHPDPSDHTQGEQS